MKLPRFRFSLRTLAVFMLLVTSGMGLWWNWEPWVRGPLLEGHEIAMRAASFSPDGTLVATAGSENARVWNARTGQLEHVLQGHKKRLSYVVFSPDGSQLVTAGDDDTPRIWEPATGRLIHALEGHDGGVDSVALSPDGSRLLTGSFEDGTARLWDTRTGEPLSFLRRHRTDLRLVAYSPDGQTFLAAEREKIRVFDAESSRLLHELDNEWPVMAICYSADGAHMAATSDMYVSKVWDVASGRTMARLAGKHGWHERVAFSADGDRLFTGNWGGETGIFDPATGLAQQIIAERLLDCSPGTDRLVTTAIVTRWPPVDITFSRLPRIWDARTGECLARLAAHPSPVEEAAFSQDGRQLLVMHGATATLWRRRRPERWWGVFCLTELWATVLFAGVFVWSVWRDGRSLAKASPPSAGGRT